MLSYAPKRKHRESLVQSFGAEVGKPSEQKGALILSYPTGQRLQIPLIVSVSTPYLAGSSPRLFFGTCLVGVECQGLFLLSNPTNVDARWTVTHVPGGGQWKQTTAIRVKGFENPKEEDDPDVFNISPQTGVIVGPTVSVAAAMAAPPKDYNRLESSIVPERLVQSSWASNTLSIGDSLELKHSQRGISNSTLKAGSSLASVAFQTSTKSQNEICYPQPLHIQFTPKKNVRYCSRFRFSCDFANSIDLVLQGEGTHEENLHRPLNPIPR